MYILDCDDDLKVILNFRMAICIVLPTKSFM